MDAELRPTNIIKSFKILKGNTRISVVFEPLWGIPYSLYTFYLGLYMKSQGITDEQLGFLISLGFIASIIFSMFGGTITDALGRKKTTLIFDLLSWPLSLGLYLISGNFWMFALAQVVNSLTKICAVSWNLMVVEDADKHQQVAAYNLLNAINISVGIFTPLAGIMVKELGIVTGEKIILGFAVLSMTIMILGRNYCYRETKVGEEILKERKGHPLKSSFRIDVSIVKTLGRKPMLVMALFLSILFNSYIPIGTFTSLYYAPFLTEALKLEKSTIAILGGVNAAVMMVVFIFIIPLVSHLNRFYLMALGILLQIISLVLFITIPPGDFLITTLSVIIFALGFGLAKPFIDSLIAEVTEGKERAGIYGFYNTAISVLCAAFGFVSGYLYEFNPGTIYMVSIAILILCIGFLYRMNVIKKGDPQSTSNRCQHEKNHC